MAKSTKIMLKDTSRIQSAMAKQNGGNMTKGSFASRAQKSAAKNVSKK
ncbi:MAG: hypothetical protein LBI78_07085 [Campylobacteraceae bacterium]|jgi:hypothetical protein|nr:hypothetical protein [Campylobacteraceae bacterium]